MSQFRPSAVTESTPWYKPLGSSHSYFQRGGNLLSAAAGDNSRPTLNPSLQLKQFCLFLFASFTTWSNPSLFAVLNFIATAQHAGSPSSSQPDLKPPSRHRYGECTGFGKGACKRGPCASPRSPTFTAQLRYNTLPTSCRDSYR